MEKVSCTKRYISRASGRILKDYGRGWAQVVDKQKLETNYYHRMCENCHISASTAPRHLKIGKERAVTMIYHKMNLFLAEAITLAIIWLEIVTKRYDELCHKISRKSVKK